MYLNKQNSEYASGPKYARILNMLKLWIWQCSKYGNVTQRSEYATTCLDKVLNISWVQDSAYARIHRVLNMYEFVLKWLNRYERSTDKVLNIYHTIHSVMLLHKLMSTYWERSIQNRVKDLGWSTLEKWL